MNYFSMRHCLILFALILGTAIAFEGCKKDTSQNQDSLEPNIQQAKT